MFFNAKIAAAIVTTLAFAVPAQASIYNNTFGVTVSEGLTNGSFDTANGNPFAAPGFLTNTAAAQFTYTGPLNFNNNAAQNTTSSGDTNAAFGFTRASITAYNGFCGVFCLNSVSYPNLIGTPVANFLTPGLFLASSASAGVFKYGTYMTFDLGTVVAGTVLTITHDDGISLFQGTTRIGDTVSGATGAITETVRINTTADTVLRYSRQNGTPSILQVAVPEPMSIGLLGAGLAAVGMIRRGRGKRAA